MYASGGCCHSGGGRLGESLPHGNSLQPPLLPANSAALEAGDLGKASFTATATSRHCSGKQCRPGGGRFGESLLHGNSHQPPLLRQAVPPGVAVLPCQFKPFPERLAVGVEGVGALVGGLTQAGLRL